MEGIEGLIDWEGPEPWDGQGWDWWEERVLIGGDGKELVGEVLVLEVVGIGGTTVLSVAVDAPSPGLGRVCVFWTNTPRSSRRLAISLAIPAWI